MTGLEVSIGGVRLETPFLAASGTFGYGREYSLEGVGAVCVKGTTLEPRPGNSGPRLCETPAGLVNSIGLENPGIDHFLREDLPWLLEKGATVVLNAAGDSVDDYRRLAARAEGSGVAAIELNLSCPNVEKGLVFGTDPAAAYDLIRAVRKETSLPLWAKLSPNVTDIVSMARAAEEAGADSLSLINTLRGMVIDTERRSPLIAGGLSGPAIRPVAVRMIYEVYRAVDIPLIGQGGVASVSDALQFFLAGASAVAVGTAIFTEPDLFPRLCRGLSTYLAEKGYGSVGELVGLANERRRP